MRSSTLKITKQWLLDNKTARGGYTKPQIEALGLDWKLEKGWMGRLVGTEISVENAAIVESKAGVKEVRKQARDGSKELDRNQLRAEINRLNEHIRVLTISNNNLKLMVKIWEDKDGM
jgi:hypothetical protein